MTPAQIIRNAMRDMSQVELARRSGFTPKHICEVLSGAAPVRWRLALALEYVLKVSPNALIRAQTAIDLRKARRARRQYGEK